MEDFGRLQQRHQVFEAERDNLKFSIEELNKEKGKLEDKVEELEVQNTIAEEKTKLYETWVVALENKKHEKEKP